LIKTHRPHQIKRLSVGLVAYKRLQGPKRGQVARIVAGIQRSGVICNLDQRGEKFIFSLLKPSSVRSGGKPAA
jgi:hypothetical protein